MYWQNFCDIPAKNHFMKKKLVPFAICLSAGFIWSCNDTSDSTTADSDTTTTTPDTANTVNTAPATTVTATPLTKNDSTFVLDAAVGGLMEVQAGQLAQQNAKSQRVKDFGGMMVTDHTKANDELRSYASGHGITLPHSLPADKQKHINSMRKMQGAAFDRHYLSMMVSDHQKVIAKFKKQSESADDAQLKTWATNTLPVLQKHLDSVQAIRKGM